MTDAYTSLDRLIDAVAAFDPTDLPAALPTIAQLRALLAALEPPEASSDDELECKLIVLGVLAERMAACRSLMLREADARGLSYDLLPAGITEGVSPTKTRHWAA